MKYNIVKDMDSVHICKAPYNSSLTAFIDIYIDSDKIDESIFDNKEDAYAFAEIIVKLLEVIK